MDFNNMIPNGSGGYSQQQPMLQHSILQQPTLQQRQLQIILQQQQYILKQQQQMTLFQQQQRVLELEQQFQELVWEQQQLLQNPQQMTPQQQMKLLPRQQDVLYHQQQIMHKQRLELQLLQQQQQWQLLQQQLPVPQRNRYKGGSIYRTNWYLDKCQSQISQNITASTTVNGKSLIDIVNEHSALVYFVDNKFKEFTGSQSVPEYGNLIDKLKIIIRIIGDMNSTQNEIAENRNVPHNPATEPEVIIDYEKESTTQPEMTLTATFQDNSFLSHEDITNYAEHYRVSKNEILSWCEQQQNGRKDDSQRQIKSDEKLDNMFKIKFPGPSC